MNIQTLKIFDLCIGVTHSLQPAFLCVLYDYLLPISLHSSYSTQLLILLHHYKHFEIHKTSSSPEILLIQFIFGHFSHLTVLMRNAATPPTSRLFQNSCGKLYFPYEWTWTTKIPLQARWHSYSLAGSSLLVLQVCLKSSSDN